jgi:redox-sensing transcriptional repressor
MLPERTIERLSEYRRSLLQCLEAGKTHIYSHELAELHHNTAVQVRRDIMFIGYTSMQRKGYDVRELIHVIGEILDSEKGLNVAVIGLGNLGRAITTYFVGKRSKLNII